MRLIVAVNDEHGSPTGRCTRLSIGEECDLMADDFHLRRGGVLFRDLGAGVLRFGRVGIRYSGYSPYVGNIIHDAYEVSEADARRVVEYALRAGWHVESNALDGPLADLFRDPPA